MVRQSSPTESGTGRRLIQQALRLPKTERNRMVEALLASLDPQDDRAAPMLAAERRRRGVGTDRWRPGPPAEPLD